MKNVLNNLSNLKNKVDKLDVDKLVLAHGNLSQLSNALNNNGVKIDVYNTKIKSIEDKILDITNK